MMQKVILITGASSGFGALTARALAVGRNIVYASMIDPKGKNAADVKELEGFAKERQLDLAALKLDVTSQQSADEAVAAVLKQHQRLDVVVHNAGHMSFGPAEAFLPEQFAELYDINVLGTQRVNRAALPQMRKQGSGLLVWVGSTSTRGGPSPYLAPYLAAKAAMDSLAVSYASELARWGVETSIIVPGAFISGTNHFANAGKPQDQKRVDAYEDGPYKGFAKAVTDGQKAVIPATADVSEVARAIAEIVAKPFGQRPFRVYVDPAQDGAEVVGTVADHIRIEFLKRMKIDDVLNPVHHVSS